MRRSSPGYATMLVSPCLIIILLNLSTFLLLEPNANERLFRSLKVVNHPNTKKWFGRNFCWYHNQYYISECATKLMNFRQWKKSCQHLFGPRQKFKKFPITSFKLRFNFLVDCELLTFQHIFSISAMYCPWYVTFDKERHLKILPKR